MTRDPDAPHILEFGTAADAARYATANRPVGIQQNGRYLVVRRQDVDRMEAAGVEFAYLLDSCGYERRVITVPIERE